MVDSMSRSLHTENDFVSSGLEYDHVCVRPMPWRLFGALTLLVLIGGSSWTISINPPDASVQGMRQSVVGGDLFRQIGYSALGIIGLVGLLRSRLRIVDTKLAVLTGLFIVWAFASVLWSSDPNLTLRRLIFSTMIALGSMWLAGTRPGELPRYVFFSCVVFMAVGFVTECVLGSFRPFSAQYRFAGTLGPNHEAINAVMLFFAATSLARDGNRYKPALLGVAGFAFLALLLTKSRTAFISFVVVELWLWAADAVSRRRRALLAVGVSSVASIWALALLIGPTSIPSALLLGRETNVGSLDGRVQLWTALTPYFHQRPLSGFGYGAFWTPQRISDISASQGWGIGEAHSSYIELLLALGVPGLLLGAAALLAVWLAIRRRTLSSSSHFFTITMIGFLMFDALSESAAYRTPAVQFLLLWGVAQFIVGPQSQIQVVRSP